MTSPTPDHNPDATPGMKLPAGHQFPAPEMSKRDYYTPLTCCMPDCGEELFLTWSLSLGLTFGIVAESIEPGGAESGSWQVECMDGHVILLPGNEEVGDEDSPCALNTCDHDHADDLRTWRRTDVERLMKLLITQGGGVNA